MAENKEEVVIIHDDETVDEPEVKETKKGFHPIEFIKGFTKKHPAIVGVSAAGVGMGLAYILGGKIQGGPHTVVNNYDFGNAGSNSDDEETDSESDETEEEDEE